MSLPRAARPLLGLRDWVARRAGGALAGALAGAPAAAAVPPASVYAAAASASVYTDSVAAGAGADFYDYAVEEHARLPITPITVRGLAAGAAAAGDVLASARATREE